MGPADNPDMCFGTFEWVAIGSRWDKATWALQLKPYLAGEAQVAYMTLSEGQAHDYEVVKAVILDRVGLSAEQYCQKFWALRWTGNQSPRAFAQRLEDWATRWLWPSTRTVDEIMDMVVLKQFLQGLLGKYGFG